MSGTWFFSLAAVLNIASVVLLVVSTRERKRIEDARRAIRRDRADEIRATVRRRP